MYMAFSTFGTPGQDPGGMGLSNFQVRQVVAVAWSTRGMREVAGAGQRLRVPTLSARAGPFTNVQKLCRECRLVDAPGKSAAFTATRADLIFTKVKQPVSAFDHQDWLGHGHSRRPLVPPHPPLTTFGCPAHHARRTARASAWPSSSAR